LVDPETKEVALANKELGKLMSVNEQDEALQLAKITERIKEKIFKPYNYA